MKGGLSPDNRKRKWPALFRNAFQLSVDSDGQHSLKMGGLKSSRNAVLGTRANVGSHALSVFSNEII